MGTCLGKAESTARPSDSRPDRPKGRKGRPSPLTLPRDETSNAEGTDYQPRGNGRIQSVQHVPRSVLLSLTSVQLYNDPSPPECPYCQAPGKDKADMIICNSETIPYDMFQLLMERGWWRTGNIIFRPQQESICCPSYAIRSPVSEYKLSKNHRKVLKRWKEFLMNGDPRWDNRGKTIFGEGAKSLENVPVSLEELNDFAPQSLSRVLPTAAGVEDDKPQLDPTGSPAATGSKKRPKKEVRPGLGPDPNKPPCMKAKERRRKGKETVGNASNSTGNLNSNNPSHHKLTLLETLKAHDDELSNSNPKHKLEIRLVPSNDLEMRTTLSDFFSLYNRFQDGVHPGKSKFKTSLDLHWAFIKSPLRPSDKGERPMGTYHMRYYLDGELVMLSVLDILPSYLVSIYFVYDPAIRFLQPGIYTCLREIALIQELQRDSPELVYYNLGFYNDFSQKINYKRQFKPTEILCPVTNTYVPLDPALPLLRFAKYCRLADSEVPERPKEEELNVDDVIILDVSCMQGRYLRDVEQPLRAVYRPVLQHYMSGTGKDIMLRMLISR